MASAAPGRRYSVRLHFSAGLEGRQVDDASLRILMDERVLLELPRTGPSVSLALPPGRYVAEASYGGTTRRRTLQFGEAGGTVAFIHFPAPSALQR